MLTSLKQVIQSNVTQLKKNQHSQRYIPPKQNLKQAFGYRCFTRDVLFREKPVRDRGKQNTEAERVETGCRLRECLALAWSTRHRNIHCMAVYAWPREGTEFCTPLSVSHWLTPAKVWHDLPPTRLLESWLLSAEASLPEKVEGVRVSVVSPHYPQQLELCVTAG